MSVKNRNVRDDVKVEDPELKAQILEEFTNDRVVLCTVLSAMDRSVVIAYKAQK